MEKIEAGCQKCNAAYLWLIDTVPVEGEDVQFLACFQCQKGYTRHGKKMEMIV